MNCIRRVIAVFGLLALCGCDSVLMDAEEKINAAVPLSRESQLAQAELIARTPADQRKKIETEIAGKLKWRAVTCGKGYTPSRFTSLEKVQQELTDRACFNETDSALATWVGRRLVAAVLAEPPLKPIPTTPPRFIVGDSTIMGAQFASGAGIGMLLTQQSLQIVELESGKAIFSEPKSDQQLGTLSPNGRLFTSGNEGRIKIRSAETGALLLEIPKTRVYQFRWLGNTAALYNLDDANKVMLVDFARGKEVPVPELQGGTTFVAPMAGDSGQFLAGTFRSIVKFSLERTEQETRVKLVDEKPLAGSASASNTSGLTADGAHWFAGSRDLSIVSLKTLEQEKISFAPMLVQTATATPDSDKLLLNGYVMGINKTVTYLFSLADRTIAEVDRGKLISERLIYIPTIKKLATITDSKIALLDELPAGEAIPLADFVARSAELANLQKMEDFKRLEAMKSGAAPSSTAAVMAALYASARPSFVVPPTGMLALYAAMAKDAQIEAVGVYQGPRAPLRGEAGQAGAVEVRVRKALKPILLVLSSYETVRWDLKLEPGAQLAGVLVSSYKPSSVTGNGTGRALVIGTEYAYKLDTPEYNALNLTVQRLTGKTIYYFQGRYEGSSFSVGGG